MWFVLLLLLTLIFLQRADAQADTGSISGSVTDAQSAVLPNAAVTATRTESDTAVTATSNARGEYIFPNLQTGHYTVSATAVGFVAETKQGYELNDGSAFSVNFTLRVGSNSEQVIVTSEVGELVNTQTGQVERVIDGETVRDLALNGRNYLDLLSTLPGAVTPGSTDAMDEITSGSTTTTVLNGMRATANGLYIDGTINKDISTNSAQFNNVGIDFIDHVSVQMSSYSAQYGDSAGPAINVVTRSGTNQLHGSAFELMRNNIWDAAGYFSRNATTFQAIPNHLRFNDFGGALGFPVLHDKLFVFLGSEWKVIAQTTAASTVTLPTMAALEGDFLSSSGGCDVESVAALNLGVNQTTCNIANQMTPWGKGLAKIYEHIISKATSYAGNVCNTDSCDTSGATIFELPQPYVNREHVLRVDWNINSRNLAYGRWILDTHKRDNPLGSGSLPTSSYHEHVPANNALLSYTHTISPNTFNEVSVAGLWTSDRQVPLADDWEKSYYGFSYDPLYTDYNGKLGIPSVAVAGYTSFSSDNFLANAHTTYMQGKDLLTWVHGNHTVKVGALLGRNRRDQTGAGASFGTANFTTQASLYTTDDALADALLGNFQSYSEAAYNPYGLFRMWQASGFAEDIWRITRHVSLDLGLRYEWTTPWVSRYDNLASFYPQYYDANEAVTVNEDGTVVAGSGNRFNGLRRAGDGIPSKYTSYIPTAASSDVASVPTIGKRGFYNSQKLFAPRLDFAWDVFGNGSTALRGGGGFFYDLPQGSVAYAALNSPPYLPSMTVQDGNMDSLSGYESTQSTHTFGSIYATDPNLVRSYIYQYNIGIQRQLPKGIFAEVDYVGNQGRHLLHNPDINGINPETEHDAYVNNPKMKVDFLRPYKGYTSIYLYRSDADSNYNGVQAMVNRRFGMARFSASYTYSKALSTASDDNEVPLYAAFFKSYSYAYSTYDRRQVALGTFSIQTPNFHRLTRYINRPASQWLFTGIVRYQSGSRQTPYGTDSYGVQNRAVWDGYPVQYEHKAAAWWNVINTGDVVNFEAPDEGQVGNSPKGIVLGPYLFNADLSARKNFVVHERYHLTLNVDAFNLSNHPQLSDPTVNVSSGLTNHYVAGTKNTLDYKSQAITKAGRPRNLQGGIRMTF